MDYYPVIDISSWKYENISVSGSKEKRWYRSPDKDELALFKLPVSLTSDNNHANTEYTGEPWSEKISSEIGNQIGFSTHKVDIGMLQLDDESISYYGLGRSNVKPGDKIIGALCWSFLDEASDSLVEGADMIMDFDNSYNRESLKGEKEIYNFHLLYRLFRKNNMEDFLFQMILFDTLIGNTDRHQDNFGVIRNEQMDKQVFAPFYDNSSSLGRELNEDRMKLMLRDTRMFEAYLHGSRSTTLIRWSDEWTKKRLNIFALYEKVKSKHPQEINQHLSKISKLNDYLLYNIIYKVPPEVMSELKKELVFKIVKTRKEYLLSKR